MLTRKVSRLTSTIDDLKSDHTLTAGQRVSPLHATTLDGKPTQLQYSDSAVDTVVYVFSPSCHWCKENLAGLHALADEAHGRYRVVGLSLSRDGLQDYVAKQHLTFPIYMNPIAQDMAKYHLGGTPETFVVAPNGTVRKVWMGAYLDDQRKEIEQSLAISLPQCCS